MVASKIAAELGTSMPRLALAWCLKAPNVSTAILGATRPEQVVENVQAVDVLPMLTDDVMAMINAVSVEGIEVDYAFDVPRYSKKEYEPII